MPESWDESITAEVAGVLAESRCAADSMLDLAHNLEVNLPGTKAAFRDGILRQSKVAVIARATAVLDPAEARAAEQLVLDRAGRLTPGALRAAIARAVMEVAPKKAKKRREVAAKFARVERWAEDSGNAALAGRELPPDEVLAVDQRITWWAGELRRPDWRAAWTRCAPGRCWTCCWVWTPGPARTAGRLRPRVLRAGSPGG